MGAIGKQLFLVGLVVAFVGLLLIAAERYPWLRIGKLPGDFYIERGSWRFYFPLATCILLSLLLTVVLWLFRRR